MSNHEEAISTIRADIHLIEGRRNEFTPVPELKQVETLLGTLDLKLHYFPRFLPTPTWTDKLSWDRIEGTVRYYKSD